MSITVEMDRETVVVGNNGALDLSGQVSSDSLSADQIAQLLEREIKPSIEETVASCDPIDCDCPDDD